MIVKSAKLGKVGGKVLLADVGKPKEGEGRREICASTDLKVAKMLLHTLFISAIARIFSIYLIFLGTFDQSKFKLDFITKLCGINI